LWSWIRMESQEVRWQKHDVHAFSKELDPTEGWEK
jgi:hypothetical protein